MKRKFLFLATSLAIVLVLSVAALFRFGSARISFATSKWLAKRSMGVDVIERPSDAVEPWLVDRGGAQLAGTQNMIGALERLKAAHNEPLPNTQVAAFGITGHVGAGLKRLFMSHPPPGERIAALHALGR